MVELNQPPQNNPLSSVPLLKPETAYLPCVRLPKSVAFPKDEIVT